MCVRKSDSCLNLYEKLQDFLVICFKLIYHAPDKLIVNYIDKQTIFTLHFVTYLLLTIFFRETESHRTVSEFIIPYRIQE